MIETTAEKCHCGDPMFVKAGVREGSYLACHHCERPCEVGADNGCPRCIQMNAWLPNLEGPGYNQFKGGKK